MQESGIELPTAKEPLVYHRLVKRLRVLDLKDYSEYCSFVSDATNTAERTALVSALTTNTTRFFRENHHFELLANSVLPKLLEKARGGARDRIWSAGCSSGEEPYSIAFTVLRHYPALAEHDIEILATDIDPQILARAERGDIRLSLLMRYLLSRAPRCLTLQHLMRGIAMSLRRRGP